MTFGEIADIILSIENPTLITMHPKIAYMLRSPADARMYFAITADGEKFLGIPFRADPNIENIVVERFDGSSITRRKLISKEEFRRLYYQLWKEENGI